MMTLPRSFYFKGIAAVALFAATIFSAIAQPEISHMDIIVTQVVQHPFPQRMAPFGVDARANSSQGDGVTTVHAAQPAASGTLPDTVFAWNMTVNEVQVPAKTANARFAFIVTNISSEAVKIISAPASCGCTTANLELPKILQPQEHVGFDVHMNVAGKNGTVEKTVSINTDKGSKVLIVRTIIAPEDMTMLSESARKDNLMVAGADRQAVFRDDCARCHVEPTRGKMGKELFVAACGICHDSEHRASMVTDLRNLKVESSAAYWMTWITYGKPNSLMPAFSQGQGGILTSEQITSLVDYLVEAIPSKPSDAFSKTKEATTTAPVSIH